MSFVFRDDGKSRAVNFLIDFNREEYEIEKVFHDSKFTDYRSYEQDIINQRKVFLEEEARELDYKLPDRFLLLTYSYYQPEEMKLFTSDLRLSIGKTLDLRNRVMDRTLTIFNLLSLFEGRPFQPKTPIVSCYTGLAENVNLPRFETYEDSSMFYFPSRSVINRERYFPQ